MIITSKLACMLLAVTAAVPVAAGGAPAAAAAPDRSALSWAPCRTLVEGWDPEDGRTECTTVPVPLDYARPDGRKIDLTVSRIRATSPSKRQGAVLINPGGPGNSGVGMPAILSKTSVAGIGVDHDLIGFDPRGVALSGGKECDPAPSDGAGPDPKASEEEQYRQGYRQTARYNARCAAYDPEFVSHLSTNVVARDVDRIRVALGEEKISFYGISWGTALGAVYRGLYDRHVDRMLLDSVMPPDFSMEAMNDGPVAAAEAEFGRFARWTAARDGRYHLGRTPAAVKAEVVALARELDRHPRTVTPPGGASVSFGGGRLRTVMAYQQDRWPDMAATAVAMRDGGTPPLLGDEGDAMSGFGLRDSRTAGILMQTSVLCNDQGPDPDADATWRREQQRRAASPLFSWEAGYQHWCAGWPLPAQPWHLHRGTSALQLVGHRYETVTPYVWAEGMQRRIGGGLLTVDNGAHGSLDQIPCGSRAVEFFSTGHVSNGTCPGSPAARSGA